MTQEEAKEILISTLRDINSDNEGFECTTEQFTEAMLIAIEELSKSSLPSNLDDAALKAYPKMSRLSEPHGVIPADNETHYLGDANEENRAAFKAGAKWQAEQIVKNKEKRTIKGWVARDSFRDPFIGTGLILHYSKPYRIGGEWSNKTIATHLPWSMFPDLKWEDEPIKVELTISKI